MAGDTRALLLHEAESLLRTRGFSGFSYADLSERVGIRKASIHHHFPTKEALGIALVDGYLANFEAALATVLAEEKEAPKRLALYGGFFAESMLKGMMPLCGALSAERAALPTSLQDRVRHFFELHLAWLKTVVTDGIAAGELRADLDPDTTAGVILSALEGVSLVAWALGDASLIEPTLSQVIASLANNAASRVKAR